MWAGFAALANLGRDPHAAATAASRGRARTPTLREWFAAEARARGLDVVADRAGNQWAWWGDPDADGPGVVTGSHLDSVPDGGAFDGPLGVVCAFAALDALRAAGVRPGAAARRRPLRRRGGRAVRRRLRRVAADHRRAARRPGAPR